MFDQLQDLSDELVDLAAKLDSAVFDEDIESIGATLEKLDRKLKSLKTELNAIPVPEED